MSPNIDLVMGIAAAEHWLRSLVTISIKRSFPLSRGLEAARKHELPQLELPILSPDRLDPILIGHPLPDGGLRPAGGKVVINRQKSGFWGRLSGERSHPEFGAPEVPANIYTFDPWIGCLWGRSCSFCYVPDLMVGHYPGGREGYWFKQWGSWLLPKPEITARLQSALLDRSGRPKQELAGAFVFMSPKTDPFLPVPQALETAVQNLKVFGKSNVFLMCQTRSPEVVEDSRVFEELINLGRKLRVGVSFSISSDLLSEQRRIERGGIPPDRRLRIMRTLKSEGIFVSAAISPLMPHSREFSERIVNAANHASIQVLRPTRIGSSTPAEVREKINSSVEGYDSLAERLADQLLAADTSRAFSWGIGNKGFIGAFLAARRFYPAAME